MICHNTETTFATCIETFNTSIIILSSFDGYSILFHTFKFTVLRVISWLLKAFATLKVHCTPVVGIWKNLHVLFIYLENVHKHDHLHTLPTLHWLIEIKFIYSY